MADDKSFQSIHDQETLEEERRVKAERRLKWDKRYYKLAQHVSDWSKDPNAKIGAVISNSNVGRVVGLGINGFPVNIEDDIDRLHDKSRKLDMVLHAEQNAILSAGRDARDANIYVFGKPICNHCAALIIQAGIDRVIAVAPKKGTDSVWDKKGLVALEMFEEANVRFTEVQADWLD